MAPFVKEGGNGEVQAIHAEVKMFMWAVAGWIMLASGIIGWIVSTEKSQDHQIDINTERIAELRRDLDEHKSKDAAINQQH